jgi:2-keto-3-deoxy-L-rhamnonate aldolase RhmA
MHAVTWKSGPLGPQTEFKKQLRDGTPKIGLFLNSHSPTVAEQLGAQRI